MEPVAVIIPTLNEADAIGAVVAELPRAIARQVIVADSGSRDGTPEVATRAGATVVSLTERGYGRRVRPARRRPNRRVRCWCFSMVTARIGAIFWT